MNKGIDYLSQLVSYIKKNLRKGYTKESLKWALVGQGHSKLEIDRAFEKAEKEFAREAPVLKTKPKITREFISEPETSPQIPPQPKPKRSFLGKWFGE